MKTRTVMRADLRTDLKDPGGATPLWADAELNRCIERAVSDLSRMLPRDRLYEEILNFAVTGDSVIFPVDTDVDKIVAAESLTGKANGNTCTIDGQPDVPRPLTVTITDANDSITGLVITIDGYDEDMLGVQEVFTYAVGQSKTLTGSQYFKYVSAVTLTQVGGVLTGDTLEIGVGTYTNVWMSLDYHPVKWASETGTEAGSTAIVRNTDFYIDYVQGKVKAISGGKIAAGETCTFAYTKDQMTIDISALDNLMRIFRVEYPVGSIPQVFCQFQVWASQLTVIGQGENEGQTTLMDKKQVRIYYDAAHIPPSDFASGTIPEFLETSVELQASAYALFIYVTKALHQALTDLGTARAAIAAAEAAQVALAALLSAISTEAGKGDTALSGVAAYLGVAVAACASAESFLTTVTGDLSSADGVAASYIGATNYVSGGTAPDIKKYLDDGDALLNTIAVGGEQQEVPNMYRQYAQTVKDALVAAYETHRSLYQQDATARTNAALGFVQSASQEVASARALIDEANVYAALGQTLVGKVNAALNQIASYLQEAAHSIEVSGGDIVMADRFKTESIARRDEATAIWKDRKQYLSEFATSSLNQIPH